MNMNNRKKSATPYFIAMAIVAAIVFYLGYNVVEWENDWMYAHKLLTLLLFAISAGAFGYLFYFIRKNT